MAYRLRNGAYGVKCRFPRCPFNAKFEISQSISGITERDVEKEAKRWVKDTAKTKHDSLYGAKHSLTYPQVYKVSGAFELIGVTKGVPGHGQDAVSYRMFEEGEIILKRGDDATTICEVIQGYAYPERNPSHRYHVGDCFGAAALVSHQHRTIDIISGKDGTKIAFYNVIELSKKDPKKARTLYNRAMEDIFKVIKELEQKLK